MEKSMYNKVLPVVPAEIGAILQEALCLWHNVNAQESETQDAID
jgi:hypothetical protein